MCERGDIFTSYLDVVSRRRGGYRGSSQSRIPKPDIEVVARHSPHPYAIGMSQNTSESILDDAVMPSPDERAQAARAHLSVWLSLLPLFGVFAAVGIYSRNQRSSPWVSQQALQSALFQIIFFNLLLITLAIVVPVSALAWDGTYDGGSLVLAVFLSALPFLVAVYLSQGLLATRAAAAIRRGEDFRHPIVGRLVGSRAMTAAQFADNPADAAEPTTG